MKFGPRVLFECLAAMYYAIILHWRHAMLLKLLIQVSQKIWESYRCMSRGCYIFRGVTNPYCWVVQVAYTVDESANWNQLSFYKFCAKRKTARFARQTLTAYCSRHTHYQFLQTNIVDHFEGACYLFIKIYCVISLSNVIYCLRAIKNILHRSCIIGVGLVDTRYCFSFRETMSRNVPFFVSGMNNI